MWRRLESGLYLPNSLASGCMASSHVLKESRLRRDISVAATLWCIWLDRNSQGFQIYWVRSVSNHCTYHDVCISMGMFSRGSVHMCEPHTHTMRGSIRRDTCTDPLIICYVCGPHTHIIRDYKSSNPRVNIGLALLLYLCVAHTHEPNAMADGWPAGPHPKIPELISGLLIGPDIPFA